MAREGFYAIGFAGVAEEGFGILVLDTDVIVGADVAGVKYDGTYEYNSRTEKLDISVTLTIPAGVGLVTGAPVAGIETQLSIVASIPADLAIKQDHYFQVSVGGRPVNVKMFKLRDFPG